MLFLGRRRGDRGQRRARGGAGLSLKRADLGVFFLAGATWGTHHHETADGT